MDLRTQTQCGFQRILDNSIFERFFARNFDEKRKLSPSRQSHEAGWKAFEKIFFRSIAVTFFVNVVSVLPMTICLKETILLFVALWCLYRVIVKKNFLSQLSLMLTQTRLPNERLHCSHLVCNRQLSFWAPLCTIGSKQDQFFNLHLNPARTQGVFGKFFICVYTFPKSNTKIFYYYKTYLLQRPPIHSFLY